jgi:hypothetical protein
MTDIRVIWPEKIGTSDPLRVNYEEPVLGSFEVYHRGNQMVVVVALPCLCAQSMCVFKLSLSWQSY